MSLLLVKQPITSGWYEYSVGKFIGFGYLLAGYTKRGTRSWAQPACIALTKPVRAFESSIGQGDAR